MSVKWGFLCLLLVIGLVACQDQDDTTESEEPVSKSPAEDKIDQRSDENATSPEEGSDEKKKMEKEDDSDSSSFDPDISAPEVSAPKNISPPEVSAPEVSVSWENEEIIMEVPDHLLFALDESTLREEAIRLLEEISGELEQYETADVAIHGHTDNQGNTSYNQNLSEERAEAVEAFFLAQDNINDFAFTTKGLGEDQPIVPNNTQENREKNRRVEIIIHVDA